MKDNFIHTDDKDIHILKALYFGNHLNSNELERALKILYLLDVSVKERIKEVAKK